MEYFKSNYNLIATIIFATFIVIAHIFAESNYDWTRNTISDLGAQAYSRKAIMQLGFLTFGLVLAIGILLNGVSIRTLSVLIYGICVALTGVFCTKPFTGILSYSELQSTIHSALAQIAGLTFSIGILIQMFTESDKSLKAIHLVFFILIIGLSAAFGLIKNYQGVAQRLLYLSSFIWLTKYYKP